MIENLKQIEEKLLLDLLGKPEKWNTLLVSYHPPMVERLWTQIGNYRVLLHFIHQCEREQALFHPHPWPSAMHVLHGKYEMGLGFGPGLVEPEKMCTIVLDNGGAYYDMTHIDGWHYVRPVGGPCATVMLIGKPWDREEIKSDEPLGPLAPDRKFIILEWFENYYREKIMHVKVGENEKIKRQDWVMLDESVMRAVDKRGKELFIGKPGFVIGRERNMIDVRFGNDRTQIHAKFLTLLDPANKPDNKAEEEKETQKKKLDDMDPKNWPDDSEDEI